MIKRNDSSTHEYSYGNSHCRPSSNDGKARSHNSKDEAGSSRLIQQREELVIISFSLSAKGASQPTNEKVIN